MLFDFAPLWLRLTLHTPEVAVLDGVRIPAVALSTVAGYCGYERDLHSIQYLVRSPRE